MFWFIPFHEKKAEFSLDWMNFNVCWHCWAPGWFHQLLIVLQERIRSLLLQRNTISIFIILIYVSWGANFVSLRILLTFMSVCWEKTTFKWVQRPNLKGRKAFQLFRSFFLTEIYSCYEWSKRPLQQINFFLTITIRVYEFVHNSANFNHRLE